MSAAHPGGVDLAGAKGGAAGEKDIGELTGYTVGITASRRREEFGAALERRGAAVIYAPAIRIVPVADDEVLRQLTQECVDKPPDILIATTGIGFRSWIEAADGWGMAEALLEALATSTLLARGPKVRGAMRAAGLSGEWSPESESINEVLERLLQMDLTGRRIFIQEHGEPLPDVVDALRESGGHVIEVPVYRWTGPTDPAPLQRMCRQVAGRELDAITFTSAPAAASFLAAATESGQREAVLKSLGHDVLAVAVGPVTAAPLERAGLEPVQPARARLGAMVREISIQVPARFGRRIMAAGHALEIRGQGVVVDGSFVTLSRSAIALLRLLARQPGRVVSRAELINALDTPDEHALETAIGRLRNALGDARIIQTLVKRGYRLAFDPEAGQDWRY